MKNKGLVIGIVLLAVTGLGLGIYFYNKNKGSKKGDLSGGHINRDKTTGVIIDATKDEDGNPLTAVPDATKTSPELATSQEKNEIMLDAMRLKTKTTMPNIISKLSLDNWTKVWNNAKVTMKEYNVLHKFLTTYNKNETETLKSMTFEEQNLVKGLKNRIL